MEYHTLSFVSASRQAVIDNVLETANVVTNIEEIKIVLPPIFAASHVPADTEAVFDIVPGHEHQTQLVQMLHNLVKTRS
jgi:hypothetical protein